MPSWGETLDEVNSREQNGEESVLDHMIRGTHRRVLRKTWQKRDLLLFQLASEAEP